MSDLKKQLIKLGATNPELRPHIRKVLQKTAASTFPRASSQTYDAYTVLVKQLDSFVDLLRSDGGNVDAAWLRSTAEAAGSTRNLIADVHMSGAPLTPRDAQSILDLVLSMAEVERRMLLFDALEMVEVSLARKHGKGFQLAGYNKNPNEKVKVHVWLPWLVESDHGKGLFMVGPDSVFVRAGGNPQIILRFNSLPLENGRIKLPIALSRTLAAKILKLFLSLS